MRIFIGHDERETVAYGVAAKTAQRWGCEVVPLREDRLRMSGLLTRPVDRRDGMFDLNSNAPQATEFAITRFFVPLLAHAGWCLFVDSDVVFMENPMRLMSYAQATKAVHVVQHPALMVDGVKMRGQVQSSYRRKLWSSVILWNCEHAANKRLNLTNLNQWPGRDLHGFDWLADEEIGELPPVANWLVGLQPKPEQPWIAHYTLGTPNMPGLENSDYAEIWWQAHKA